jgi:hypothetical protein
MLAIASRHCFCVSISQLVVYNECEWESSDESVFIENAERKNAERKKHRKNKVDIYFSGFFLSTFFFRRFQCKPDRLHYENPI